jgi:ADP-dependent NAD(P)H-hydrate dehydratase / NAD(P)H-hydrate epimerase
MTKSQPVLLATEIRAIEKRCAEQGITDLMQRAGLAAANAARDMLGDTAKSVLVLAGPGNNGGDAFEVACHLKDWFFRVTVFFSGDPAKLPEDAKRAHAKWVERKGHTIAFPPEQHGKYDLIVDGLFGVGLSRAPAGIYSDAVEYTNLLGAPVLALDVASGLNADTGAFFARGDRAGICATRTITFIGLKPGLFMLDGVDCSGGIELADLGIDAAIPGDSAGRTVGTDLFAGHLKPRAKNSNKGSMGSVAVIGGAAGMTGAALLAGRAALKLGAGKVYCGLVQEAGAPAFDPDQLELMLRPADSLFEPGVADAIVAGPGMGTSDHAKTLLKRALAAPVPLVLDADALNLVSADSALARDVAARKHPTLITPHPGEAARLLAKSIAEVQADRIAAAQLLAKQFNCTALLKGAGSVIAGRGGRWFINTSGNPGMASAGMGDVLSGMLGTLLAQGWDGLAAMQAGVHLHGCAADACVAEGRGPAGLTASEVTEAARSLFNVWNQ